MNLKVSIVAEREIEAAADYYETQEAGLITSLFTVLISVLRGVEFRLLAGQTMRHYISH